MRYTEKAQIHQAAHATDWWRVFLLSITSNQSSEKSEQILMFCKFSKHLSGQTLKSTVSNTMSMQGRLVQPTCCNIIIIIIRCVCLKWQVMFICLKWRKVINKIDQVFCRKCEADLIVLIVLQIWAGVFTWV